MMTLQAEIYENSTVTYTKSLYQYDKNVRLIFDGIDLPRRYEVHFSNERDSGISVACKGAVNGVIIPNELLSTGQYIYAWVCGIDNDAEKDIRYTVVIPVIPRPIPVPVQSTQEAQPIITDYEISADDENLTFGGLLNDILDNSKEPIEDNSP